MAQSPTERITALEKTVERFSLRVKFLVKEVESLRAAQKSLAKELADLQRNFDRESALLKREVDDLRKWKEESKKAEEEWGRKLWMIVPPVLAVIISNVMTVLVMLYFKR